MSHITMEVCCYDLESAIGAQAAGADRIELCADRHQGGTTPSYGTMEIVRKQVRLPVFVMIRPRGGDFLYSKFELEAMIHDIQMAKELGMEGVVTGVLMQDGQIDMGVMQQLIKIARPLQITFHRAFDLTPDAIKSLSDLINLGIDRVLTSGQKPSVSQGLELIKSLIDFSGENIIVMPGAGISEENVAEILRTTGASEFHVSASGLQASKMVYKKMQVTMGDKASDYSVDIADSGRIKKFREIRDQLSLS